MGKPSKMYNGIYTKQYSKVIFGFRTKQDNAWRIIGIKNH